MRELCDCFGFCLCLFVSRQVLFCVADSIQHLVGQPQNGNESSRNSIVMLVELELSGRQVGSATADDVGVG